MADFAVIEKPARWDLPFSIDLPDRAECRELTDEDVDRLLAVEPFSKMDPKRFPKTIPLRGILKNDVRIRYFRDGDMIVRQGDYGNSAFLILEGAVRVILRGLTDDTLGRQRHPKIGWLASLARLWRNPSSPEVRDASSYPKTDDRSTQSDDEAESGKPVFVQDVPNILRTKPDTFDTTHHELMSKGQLFGELAALGRIPRATTVVSVGQKETGAAATEILEIRWQGLRDLRKYDEALRQHVDGQFRKFGLAVALRACPLLENLGMEEIAQVATAARFETFGSYDWYGSYQKLRRADVDPLEKEPIIAQEGDIIDGILLIYNGFARLSRRFGHGQHTFGYLGKGDVFGIHSLVDIGANKSQSALRATLRAIGYVDLVRIPRSTFEEVIRPHVSTEYLRERLDRVAALESVGQQPAIDGKSAAIEPALIEFLVENRFINGSASMMISLDRCTRCDDCVRACAGGHTNNPRFIRHGEIFGNLMIANACMQCVDPVCMIGCPTGAIQRSLEGGEVLINDNTCIGCGVCAHSCPYDNIRLVEVRDQAKNDAIMVDPIKGNAIVKATKCDLCIEYKGGPACELACPHDALKRLDMRDMESLAAWLNRS